MPDVSVLVYAHREDSPEHQRYADWLSDLATSQEPFAMSELVLHGFVRVVTHPKFLGSPSTIEQALRFVDNLLAVPGCNLIRPGARHWSIFRRLCETAKPRGAVVADAVHAALAIESGCEWVSADTDFARFAPPLRWKCL